jgi:hypothetical protein
MGNIHSKDTDDGSSEQVNLILARKLHEDIYASHWNEAWPPFSSSPAPGPSFRPDSRVSPPVPMSRTPQADSGYWKGPDRTDSNDLEQESLRLAYKMRADFFAEDLDSNYLEHESLLLAYKMQTDFFAEDSDLRGQLHATFKCGICFDELLMDYVCVIDDRGHNVCRACLKDYITVQLREHRFPIFCPLCSADKTSDPQRMQFSTSLTLFRLTKGFKQWSLAHRQSNWGFHKIKLTFGLSLS